MLHQTKEFAVLPHQDQCDAMTAAMGLADEDMEHENMCFGCATLHRLRDAGWEIVRRIEA